jgi:hypothetical protein
VLIALNGRTDGRGAAAAEEGTGHGGAVRASSKRVSNGTGRIEHEETGPLYDAPSPLGFAASERAPSILAVRSKQEGEAVAVGADGYHAEGSGIAEPGGRLIRRILRPSRSRSGLRPGPRPSAGSCGHRRPLKTVDNRRCGDSGRVLQRLRIEERHANALPMATPQFHRHSVLAGHAC